MIEEVSFKDWPVPGPRTVVWCAQFVEKRGGPVAHHRWWVSAVKLQPTDYGVAEHEHAMRAFEWFGEYDQVDMPNLAGLEVIMRRAQTIEYHHERRLKSNQAKDNPSGLSRNEAAYFVGTHKTTGEVMISPDLVEWVAKEMGKDAEIDKQLRKSREEAKLSRAGDGK